jgi:CheY-like chemotaxis protein
MSAAFAKRILVVDDEEDVRILVCRILRDLGYEVDAAADGAEALAKIAGERPDLIILDLMMPGVDGWSVLSELRRHSSPPPVVVMTALADYPTFARVVKEGASAYVCKPFRFHELVATCQGVLMAESTKASPPTADEDRRRFTRRPLMVEVRVLSREMSPIALGELMNLSFGGAQVDLGVPLEKGAPIRVAFHVPGVMNRLTLQGQILWRGPSPRGFSHGLSFVNLSAEEDRQLSELLQSA